MIEAILILIGVTYILKFAKGYMLEIIITIVVLAILLRQPPPPPPGFA